jgi:hypothetical protein
MIIDYKCFPSVNGLIYRPMIQVKIYIGPRCITALGLLDSGCDKTLIDKNIAKQLFADFKTYKKESVVGVNGIPISAFASEIDIEVPGLTGKIEHAQISYGTTSNVAVLLGHIGFFEFFNVKFDTAQKQFEINPNPNTPMP